MGRKSRMKRERKLDGFQSPGTIELRNPEKERFGAFITANAEHWRQQFLKKFKHVHEGRDWSLADPRIAHLTNESKVRVIHIPVVRVANRIKDNGMVQQDCAKGKTLAICGAGPSLKDTAAEYCPRSDHVWGCNSALTWLAEQGYNPTHGFSVDQTTEMLREWKTTPDVEYLIASSVHPHLTQLLIKRDRKFKFFHNYCGIPGAPVEYDGESSSYEDWLYSATYPGTIRVGSGLNSVNRAIDLAMFMGYSTIYVLGADCAMKMNAPEPKAPVGSPEHVAWLDKHTVMHVNGDSSVHNGASCMTFTGTIDGVTWLTKPDMAVSASWLIIQARESEGRVHLIGDTLPGALKDKPDSFLKRMPMVTGQDGKIMFPSTVAA